MWTDPLGFPLLASVEQWLHGSSLVYEPAGNSSLHTLSLSCGLGASTTHVVS